MARVAAGDPGAVAAGDGADERQQSGTRPKIPAQRCVMVGDDRRSPREVLERVLDRRGDHFLRGELGREVDVAEATDGEAAISSCCQYSNPCRA